MVNAFRETESKMTKIASQFETLKSQFVTISVQSDYLVLEYVHTGKIISLKSNIN